MFYNVPIFSEKSAFPNKFMAYFMANLWLQFMIYIFIHIPKMSSLIFLFNRNNCNTIKTQFFALNYDNHYILLNQILILCQAVANNTLTRTIRLVNINSLAYINIIILSHL